MSKMSNALLMLFYLNNKNTYTKISELSDYLEVSDREVRRYRDDLEMAGFSIDHKTGRYGGYLLTDDVVLSMNINHMKHVLSFLQKTNVSVNLNQDHIKGIIDSLKKDQYISNHLLSRELIDKLTRINIAIKLKYRIEITYISSDDYHVNQIIEPYLIKNIREIQYLFAMHKGVLKSYQINRIVDIRQTDQAFMIDHLIYQKELNENAYGVRRGEKKYTIQFKVKGKMNHFAHHIFKGHTRLIDENQHIYEIDAYDLHEISYQFLSFGSSLEIISPEEMIEVYKKEIEKMKKLL